MNDRIKLLAYRIFDPVKANAQTVTKAVPQPDAKVESKPDPKAEAKPEEKVAPALEASSEAKPKTETKSVEPQPEAKGEPKADIKNDAKPTGAVGPKPDAKVETKSETNGKPAAEASPQLVKRVHEFYEQLGREDVRAVEELDQAKQKTLEVETKK